MKVSLSSVAYSNMVCTNNTIEIHIGQCKQEGNMSIMTFSVSLMLFMEY